VALGIERPRVGLLSIGEEETKGNDLIREAHRLLKAGSLNFIGNVEGRDVYSALADVIVCDGFTGNVALKISEGLVDVVEHLLARSCRARFSTRWATCCRCARSALPQAARLLGIRRGPAARVNGLCIVGHGRSSVKAVRNAVAMAHRFATFGVIDRLEHGIAAVSVSHQ